MAESLAERVVENTLDEVALPDGMYWVVYVSDALKLPNGEVSRVSRRFEFHGETASREAWRCYQEAKRNEFMARAEKVRKV